MASTLLRLETIAFGIDLYRTPHTLRLKCQPPSPLTLKVEYRYTTPLHPTDVRSFVIKGVRTITSTWVHLVVVSPSSRLVYYLHASPRYISDSILRKCRLGLLFRAVPCWSMDHPWSAPSPQYSITSPTQSVLPIDTVLVDLTEATGDGVLSCDE